MSKKYYIASQQTIVCTGRDLAAECRINLKEELSEPICAKAVTMALDFWSNRYNKQSFLGLNVTYVNTDYQYKVIDLLCRPFNGKKSYGLVHEVTWKKFFPKR